MMDEQQARAGQAWDDFCDSLKGAKQFIFGPKTPDTELDRAEGIRHLSRLTRIALEQMLEGSDVDFPLLFRSITPTQKYGGDSPDNIYHNATIAGDRTYRIRGKIGNAVFFSLGTKANRYFTDGTMASTGEINGKDLILGPDGSFEIILSQQPQSGNWLPMQPDSSTLVVRQMMNDWRTDTPATMTMECISGPATPPELNAAALERGLKAAAGYVNGCAKTFTDFFEKIKAAAPENTLDGSLQDFFLKSGGDPAIYYLQGGFRLAPDEALVIETAVPDCLFWNFQVNNYWMESLDYRYLPVALNKANAKYEPDGSLKIVLAARDIGHGNHMSTAGHGEGGMVLRWVAAQTHPIPTCKVIKI